MTAFIIGAARSAVVPRGGAFARLQIEDLGAPVLRACLAAAGVEPGEVGEVVLSNALGAGGNPARRVALAAGLADRVAGLTIDRQCAGGLDAVLVARAMVVSGMAEVVVAGGVESHSRRPLRLRTDPDGGAAVAYDQARFTPWPDRDPDMAQAAAALALRLGISRSAQDDWAVRSHARAIMADHRAEMVVLSGQARDPFARGLTGAVAGRAKVVTGSITAANAAVAADGAAFLVVVSERRARQAARALRIAGGATLGADPVQPGLSPLPAIEMALRQAGVEAVGLAVSEVMEAYAVQAIACVQGAGLDPLRVNIGGGALARGHPIGASGAVLAVRLFHQMKAGFGLAAIAGAGGVGSALVVEA